MRVSALLEREPGGAEAWSPHASASSPVAKLASTCGWMYDARATVGVLPRSAATAVTTSLHDRPVPRVPMPGGRAARARGGHGGHPRPEVLGGDVGVGGVPEVVVHVVRVHARRAAVIVEVLEQPLSGDLLAVPEHPGDAPVLGVHLVLRARSSR